MSVKLPNEVKDLIDDDLERLTSKEDELREVLEKVESYRDYLNGQITKLLDLKGVLTQFLGDITGETKCTKRSWTS